MSACGYVCFLAVRQSLVSFPACAFAAKQVKVSGWIMNHDFPKDVLQSYCMVRMWSCFRSPCRICTSSTASAWFHHCQASTTCKLCWKATPFCMKSLQPSINHQKEKKLDERIWWLKHSIQVNRWLRCWVDKRCHWHILLSWCEIIWCTCWKVSGLIGVSGLGLYWQRVTMCSSVT